MSPVGYVTFTFGATLQKVIVFCRVVTSSQLSFAVTFIVSGIIADVPYKLASTVVVDK